MDHTMTTRIRPDETGLQGRLFSPLAALVIYASVEPADVGRRIELDEEPVTLGRDPSNTIVIRGDHVSRHHATVERRGPVWCLKDNASANGTRLNDEPITDVTLRPNDLFKIGHTIVKFLAGDVEAAYHEVLHQLTITDGLTKVANRRGLEDTITPLIRYAKRHGDPLSAAMFDLDRFKLVNDQYGHLAGDHVLATTAALVARTIREEDTVGRYGGEEFAIIMFKTPLAEAIATAEKVRATIAAHLFSWADQVIPVSASFGVAQYDANRPTWAALLRAADEKLYEAKRSGRNRVAG